MTATSRFTTPGSCRSPRTTAINPGHAAPIVRTFTSLEHLNQTAALWLADTADVRLHRETKRRPIDLYQEEKPHLLSLPARAYDTAQVFYRTVNSEGHVAYLQNFYSVPVVGGGATVAAPQLWGPALLDVSFSISTQPRCKCCRFAPTSVRLSLPGVRL